MTDSPTVADVLARALDAYGVLAELGEEIDDEWTYVTDLAATWRDRLGTIADAHGGEPLDAEVDAAITRLIDEVGRIDDPHRAIDWLSTFPQVVELAVGAP